MTVRPSGLVRRLGGQPSLEQATVHDALPVNDGDRLEVYDARGRFPAHTPLAADDAGFYAGVGVGGSFGSFNTLENVTLPMIFAGVEPAEMAERGTRVTLQLKEDAKEFAQEHRLREIIRKHSDFIPFPIFVGSGEGQANRQTALWRQMPREAEQKDYDEFYQRILDEGVHFIRGRAAEVTDAARMPGEEGKLIVQVEDMQRRGLLALERDEKSGGHILRRT